MECGADMLFILEQSLQKEENDTSPLRDAIVNTFLQMNTQAKFYLMKST